MGIVATQSISANSNLVEVPAFVAQRPGDRIVLLWLEFETSGHDGPNTTEWVVRPAGGAFFGWPPFEYLRAYVLDRTVTDAEPLYPSPGGAVYRIPTDLSLLQVTLVALLLRDVGEVEGLLTSGNSLEAPAQGAEGDELLFYVWNIYDANYVPDSLQPQAAFDAVFRAEGLRRSVVAGVLERSGGGWGPYTAAFSGGGNYRIAYSFRVPLTAPSLDPIALTVGEDVSRLWLYPNIQMTLPPTAALDPEAAYAITDEMGNRLYTAYPREENRSADLVAYTFRTPLARLAEVQPVQALLSAAPLGQPYTARQALELILTHWKTAEGYNWLDWKPLPEIYIRGLEGNIAPTLGAVTLIPADNPDERKTAQEWLEEFLGAFEGYFLRDTSDGKLELVAPYWATDLTPALVLTPDDLLEEGQGRVIPFTQTYNRATVSNKPWTFGDAVEVVTASETSAGATSIALQQAPSDPLPSGSSVAFQLVDGNFVVVTLTAECTTTTMQVQATPALIPAGTPGRSSVRVPTETFPPAGLRVRGQDYAYWARNGHDGDGALPTNVVNLGDVIVPNVSSGHLCPPWEINPGTLLEPGSTVYLEITAQAYFIFFGSGGPEFYADAAEIRPLYPSAGSWAVGPVRVPMPADGQRRAVAGVRKFTDPLHGAFSLQLYAEWDGRRLLLSYDAFLRNDNPATLLGAFTLELHALGLSWREGSQTAVGRFGFAASDLPQVPGLAESQARAIRPAPERSIEVYSLGQSLLERVQRCVDAARAIVVNRFRPQELLELRLVPPYRVRPEHLGKLIELEGLKYELFAWQYSESHAPGGSQSELIARLRRLPVTEAIMLVWESGEGAVFESGEGIILQEVN